MKIKLGTSILALGAFLIISSGILARNSLGNLITGKVHFPKELVGKVLTMDDGRRFTVFRDLRVDGWDDDKEESAVFVVRFRFRNLSLAANRRLSLIPAPFLMGMEGLREKIWTVNDKTMTFQGIYQWSSQELAERYPESFIFGRMTRRAAPGTVKYEIFPATEISGYIQSLRDQPHEVLK
ncbi:YdhR family protein [Thermodesulfobacteriota bacterium]